MNQKQLREMNIEVTGNIHSKNEEFVIKEVASLISQVGAYVVEVTDDLDKIQVACITIVANFLERLLPLNTDKDNQTLMKKAFVLLSNHQFCSEYGFLEVQA